MEKVLIGFVFIIVILILYYIFVYNRLQRLSNSVQEASSGIDVALNKRYDLILNLVNVVKGYSLHEADLFSEVAAIRGNLDEDRDQANQQMNKAKDEMLLLVEAYPTLKANEQYLNLQKNMTNVEEHLSASRRLYNRSVTQLNNVISQFPTSIIAKNHNIMAKQFFSAQNNVEVKEDYQI